MKGAQLGNRISRDVGMKIEAVKMNQINRMSIEDLLNTSPVLALRVAANPLGNLTFKRGRFNQCACHIRSSGGDNQGTMARFNQPAIEESKNLLCPTSRVEPDWQKRISDVQNR